MNFNVKKFERILVTGSTGFIGRHLIKLISENDLFEKVRILIRKSSDENLIKFYKEIIPDLEIHFGDLTDYESLMNSLNNCDSIINLAACVTYKKVPQLNKVNVEGLKNLCEAAYRMNIKKMVHVSSTASLGYSDDKNKPLNEYKEFSLLGKGYWYAESKYKGDQVALRYFEDKGLPLVICLPSEVYGEYGLETAKNLIDFANFPVCWNGGTSVVYVKDVADGILRALIKGEPGEKYILGSENLTIKQILEKVLKFTDQNRRIIKIPNCLIEYPVKYISVVMQKLGSEPIFDPSVIKYATKYWFVNSSKARKELGFTTIDTDLIFSKTINWLKKDNLI